MKKIITIALVTASLAGTSAFGQGYFQFTSGKSQVYDGTGASAVLNSTIDVAFLWAAASTTPTVDGYATQSLKTGNNTTLASTVGYTAAQAWTDILNGQFTLAQNSADNSLVTALTSTTGSINYNSSTGFGVVGTSASTT